MTLVRASYSFYANYPNYTLLTVCQDGQVHETALTHVSENTKSFSVPENVTFIWGNAFEDCPDLESINIPNSVTTIGSEAFNGCCNLKSIIIPNSVTYIGTSAFKGCTNLQSVILNGMATCYCDFADCILLENITLVDTTYVLNGVSASGQCGDYVSAISWVLGNNGTLILYGRGQTNDYVNGTAPWINADFTTAVISEGITGLGRHLFYQCAALTQVFLPSTIQSIDYGVFQSCYELDSIILPDNVDRINSSAFGSHDMIIHAHFDSQSAKALSKAGYCFKAIDTAYTFKYQFNNNSIIGLEFCGYDGTESNVIIPNGVTSIGARAFSERYSMTNVSIPETVTTIGEYAFSNCSGLTNLVLPNSIATIGDTAFGWCTALENVEVPNSVTSIERQAFIGCDKLNDVYLPDSIADLGESAFMYCSSLTSIRLSESLTEIKGQTFIGTNLISLYIPSSINAFDSNAFDYNTNLCLSFECTNTYMKEWVLNHEFNYSYNHGNICEDKAIPATFTNDGLTEGSHCEACGDVIVAQEIIPAITYSYNMDIGEVMQITGVETPNPVTWQSDNPELATVSKAGKVRALARGTATLTAIDTVTGNTGHCTVAISPPMISMVRGYMTHIAHVRSSSGNYLKMTLNAVGGALPYLFELKVYKDGELYFSDIYHTSNASLEANVYNVNEYGDYTFYLLTVDGIGQSHEYRPTNIITISSTGISHQQTGIDTVYVEEVLIDKTTASINKGSSVTLTASVAPSDTQWQTVSWKSSNPMIATVTAEGVVNGLMPGHATIYAISKDGMNIRAACEITVTSSNVIAPPSSIVEIDGEAFIGTAADIYRLSNKVKSIGSKAFANLRMSAVIELPNSVTSIANDAFAGSDVTLVVPEGSYAETWAIANGIDHLHQ